MQSYMLLFFCFKKDLLFICGVFCLCVCVPCGCSTGRGQKRVSDFVELELQFLVTLLVSGIVSLSARVTSVLIC